MYSIVVGCETISGAASIMGGDVRSVGGQLLIHRPRTYRTHTTHITGFNIVNTELYV